MFLNALAFVQNQLAMHYQTGWGIGEREKDLKDL